MKVIFVASGNKTGGKVSAFVQSQYDSLVKEGLDMVLFPVQGKGALNYLKAVIALRKIVRKERPDIIHAHYSTCGFVASLACLGMRRRPKIMVSILGSFPTRGAKWRRVRWAIQHLWDGALTKSERTRKQLGLDLPVIPNGVNLEVFHPMDHEEARRRVGWGSLDALHLDAARLESEILDVLHLDASAKSSKTEGSKAKGSNPKYVIWCSHPERKEKRWGVAEDAVRLLESKISDASVKLVAVYDKTPEEVAMYMNAADCLLLTSESEGSPNVIKEALACNCPIVTTDVGDVVERLTGLEGCYIVPIDDWSFVIGELAKDIEKAIEFGKRTKGYERILQDRLEISQVAQRIIDVYEGL